MARELAGSSRTFLRSDQNGGFSVTGEFQNPLLGFVNPENEPDKNSVFGIQCTDEAADKRIKETQKKNQEQAEVAVTLLNLRSFGLRLTVTPNLLDLMEKNLNHSKHAAKAYHHQSMVDDLGSSEKLKAANFSAKVLKIGNWKREAKNESDLVAKCYYAKRKLVWEVLENGLKNKIEIPWNDIIAMRAFIQENQPGILELELNQAPNFYVEQDPQPRKHSKWQPATDFTGGQASSYRRHYLQFPPGSLDKHYEKLLQCDQRLYQLCHKPFPSLQSPHFEPVICRFSDFSFHYHGDHSPGINPGLPFNFSRIPSPLLATQTSFQETRSPISVMDFSHSDEQNSNKIVFDGPTMGLWGGQNAAAAETLSSPTIRFSPQVTNPAISYQNYANPSNYGQATNMFTSIEDYLFSDRQAEGCYDEQYHMARVESLNELVNVPRQLQQEENLASENGSQQAFHEQEMDINEQLQVYQQHQHQHHQVFYNNLPFTNVVNDPRMENFGSVQYQQPYR